MPTAGAGLFIPCGISLSVCVVTSHALSVCFHIDVEVWVIYGHNGVSQLLDTLKEMSPLTLTMCIKAVCVCMFARC